MSIIRLFPTKILASVVKHTTKIVLLTGCILLSACSPAFWNGFAQGAILAASSYSTPTYTPTYTSTTPSSSSSKSNVERTLKKENDGFSWYKTKQGSMEGAQAIDGTTIVPLGYYTLIYYMSDASFPSKGYFFVKKSSGQGIFTKTGKNIIPVSRGYSSITFLDEEGHVGYFSISKNGKEGACDIDGKEILAPQYNNIIFIRDKFEFLDSQGKYQPSDYTLDASGHGIRINTQTNIASSKPSSSSSNQNSPSSNSNGILHQEWYSSDGSGHDFFNNSCTGSPVALNIAIYKDHVVASGTYCEYAGTKEWEQKTGRNMAFGYAFSSKRNANGYLYEEFIQVDEKTFDITMFCREQTAYGFPNTCSIPLKKASEGGTQQMNGGNHQYQQQYPQQQNTQRQQYEQTQPKSQSVKCRVCNGTGRVEKILAGSDGGNRKYCNECQQLRSTHHYHATCETCRGKGYL